MRISTAFQYSSYTTDIGLAQQNLVQYQNELSTGLQINTMSDNPYGANQVLNMNALQSGLNQYNSNLSYAKSMLSLTDNSLSGVNTIVTQAYQLAVQGANSIVDQSGRNGMVAQINQMQSQLVSLGNAQGPNGEYLFAGQKNNTQPFTVTGSTLNYNGDNNNLTVQSGPSQSMTISSPGSPLFTQIYSQLETLKNDLTSGNTGALSNVDIQNLQNSISTVAVARAQVGANLQNVASLTADNTRRIQELTSNISNLQDVNVAQAAMQYQSAQTAYQGALQVAANGFKTSLLNYI